MVTHIAVMSTSHKNVHSNLIGTAHFCAMLATVFVTSITRPSFGKLIEDGVWVFYREVLHVRQPACNLEVCK